MHKLEIEKYVEKHLKQLNDKRISKVTSTSSLYELDINMCKNLFCSLSKSIKESISFDFGKALNMKDLVDSHIKRIHNKTEIISEILNLPYQSCWFEYDFEEFKIGTVVTINKLLDLTPYYVYKNNIEYVSISSWIKNNGSDNKWMMLPIIPIIENMENGEVLICNPFRSSIVKDAVDDYEMITPLVLTSVKILNCKNISTKEETIYKTTQIMKKGKMKNIKVPIERFHTLQLTFPRKKNKWSYDNSNSEETTMPLHFCRGHFKTFTKEKPLLGKAVGTYWWPSIIRGSEENGTVNKNYQINLKGE